MYSAVWDVAPCHPKLYILQRGVQWKQGVVFRTVLCTGLLYNTTPIHCTFLPLHPPLQSIQSRQLLYHHYYHYYVYYHYYYYCYYGYYYCDECPVFSYYYYYCYYGYYYWKHKLLQVLRICERLNMSKHIMDWMDTSEAPQPSS